VRQAEFELLLRQIGIVDSGVRKTLSISPKPSGQTRGIKDFFTVVHSKCEGSEDAKQGSGD
jgi:hypothetical protein